MDERDRIIARLKAIEEYTFAKAKSGDFWSYCLYWNRDFFIKRKFLKEVVDVLQLVHDGYKTGRVVKVAISMPPRAGKCIDGNTDIYTTSGLKKIKDISIGDKVISYLDGASTIETVVGKDKSLKKQVRIKYITGESINISPEHRLLTDGGYKAAKDITLNDFLIGYSSSLDVNNETIDQNELKFIAYMIFDGHCGLSSRSFTKGDENVKNDFENICNSLNIKFRRKDECNFSEYFMYGSPTKELCEKYGILGKLSKDKRLPDCFFKMPIAQKWEFINIMFQTDGWFDNKCGAITLASEGLIEDIKYIARTLGLKCSQVVKYNKVYDTNYYTLSFGRSQIEKILENCDLGSNRIKAKKLLGKNGYSFLEVYPSRIKKEILNKEINRRLRKSPKKNITKDLFDRIEIDCPELSKYRMDDFYYMKISEIEYIDEEIEMYDIQVTGVNNFVANGIVSHNSFTTSLFCSFMLGQFPQESIMRNSCTSSLYEDLSKSVRSMVSDDRWKRMFGIELRTKGVKTWALQTAKMNSYFGGGVGGTIIGKGATMLNISDDLYKDYKDAISDLSNDRVISWADSARGSRQELGCCTIDIGTRWRTNDIIGRGLERNDYDAVICVPALTEEGKSFCENVQTTEFYLTEMSNIAPEIWSAEYMQQPIEVKGRLFTPDELMYYEEIPEGEFEANLGVGDIADEGSDFTACPMFKKYGDKWYMYDVLFSKDKVEITQPILTGMINVNRVSRFRFESNNGGKLYAQNVAKTVDADVTWIPTTSNKESRILNDSAWIKKHVVFMANPQRGSDYHKFMEQLCSYLKEGKNAHDDAADSLSLFCRFVESLGFNRVKNDDRGEWPSIPISLSQIKL